MFSATNVVNQPVMGTTTSVNMTAIDELLENEKQKINRIHGINWIKL